MSTSTWKESSHSPSGWAQRATHLHQYTYTAEQVIVAANAYAQLSSCGTCSTRVG
jgi:hypothetical protein